MTATVTYLKPNVHISSDSIGRVGYNFKIKVKMLDFLNWLRNTYIKILESFME